MLVVERRTRAEQGSGAAGIRSKHERGTPGNPLLQLEERVVGVPLQSSFEFKQPWGLEHLLAERIQTLTARTSREWVTVAGEAAEPSMRALVQVMLDVWKR